MDVGPMSNTSVTSDSTAIDSEEDERAFIEISELDKLLGLPPPRFDLGTADIESLKAVDSAESSSNFDSDIDFSVPQKQGLPQRLRMELCRQDESETEVCYSKELAKVSVIKTEVNIESDGLEVETECHSYLSEPVPAAPLPTQDQDEMLYKRSSNLAAPTRGRSKGWGRGGCKAGTLNRVVNKLLAKSEPLLTPHPLPLDNTILQTLLLEPQCLQSPNSICDNPIPKNPPSIPSPVINKLKKLGTSVEVEKPDPLLHTINGQVAVPENPNETPKPDNIPTGYLQIMESLDKAVGLTSDLTKKKKKRSPKKTSNNQVPSTVQLLAEIENSDNLAKFSFQVDAKQVIELPEGQKLYTCDICSGVYHRGFSLKRHYLKTHINYKHISKRDLHNCGILYDPSIEKGGARKKQLIKDDSPPIVSNLCPPCDIPDLYRCHTCFKCFMLISELQAHLMEHPPVSAQNLAEDQFKNYTCENCKARYLKKKLYLRHKETCGVEPEVTHFCLFCEKSFPTFILKKKHHLQMHHPKKKLHQCYLCKTKMFKERLGVFKHLILHHSDEYVGCLSCKLRFGSREDYKKHNKENHKPLETAKKLLLHQKITAEPEVVTDIAESHPIEQTDQTVVSNNNSNLVLKCTECPKMFASHLNMTRHRRLAHKQFANKKKIHKKEISIIPKAVESHPKTKTPTPPPTALSPPTPPPPPPDPEVLFYSTIAHNIKENLTHHLDGKLDSQEVMEYDLNKATAARNKVLNFSASFTSETTPTVQPEPTSTPVQQKEPRSTPISPRAPWEKFNFPKNYDGRCGLTSYIKDMSHLDISTQLTMRRNLQRLNSTTGQESNKESPANIPAGLLLVEKPLPDCAETFGEPQINKERGGVDLVLSGEWVRPRTFLCSACGYKSSSLWDVEDHKYALHPNVWVPHIEIVGEQSSAWDWFYHRRLPPDTKVEETTPAQPISPPPCSKCGRQCAGLADLHRHMLECGGDTTWQATMLAVSSPGARRRKWRPFGSRRRKQQGRRGLKRNIPNTPAKHSCGRIRTKPGDMDTIQKMIANLPPKRATRRVIGEDPDIKTRSQTTISSVPISSIATHSSAARAASIKSSKVVKNGSKPSNQKKLKGDGKNQSEDSTRNKGNLTIKEEVLGNAVVKEEDSENEYQPLEAENTIQHSDILTSLQMIPVVRKSTETIVKEAEQVLEEPIETSKIIAAMREAMLDSEDKAEDKKASNPNKVLAANKEGKSASEDKPENKNKSKLHEKKKKLKTEDRNKKNEAILETKKSEHTDTDVIICYGCGMQFDNLSACQRHKKKCVYWKEDKSSSDNKTNKCVHCGSVFPYLMALLKHSCSKREITEEPAMPELCPEQPVEEVQCDSVEDIPILSPVDVSRDDVFARRMLLLELTLGEVANESFDVSGYHTKYFNPDNTPKDRVKSPERKKSKTTSIKLEKADDMVKPVSPLKNESSSTKRINESVSEIQAKILSESPGSTKGSPSKKLVEANKVKLPGNKQGIETKVSDIFKEVKRRGRRRQKMKVKVLVTKLGIRKTTNSSPNLKKKISPKKKRSSNFVMLMKEWEKLEKEGAVAVGKRKRVFSHSEVNFENLRSRRRRLTSENSRTDFSNFDSFTVETSRDHDRVESSPSRRTRQRDSLGTINDIPPEVLKEISEQFSSTLPENINKDKSSSKLDGSKKRKLQDSVDEDTSNRANVSSVIKTELEEPLLKRKPGRPRVKSITVETEKHIYQTIDSVLKESIDYINSDVNKDENHLPVKKNLEKQCLTSTEPPQLNVETEEHIMQAIENVIENEKQGMEKIREEGFWKNVNDIIYNVSIGNDEVLKEEDTEKTEFNSLMPEVVLKKRRRRRKRGFSKPLKPKSNLEKDATPKETHSNKEMEKPNDSPQAILKETIGQNEVKNRIAEKLVSIVTNNGNNTEDDQVIEKEQEKLPTQNIPKVEMKVVETRDEINCLKPKPKEVKTKQLSIADYLSISNVPKKSTGWSFSKENKLCGTKINESNTISSNNDTKELEKATKVTSVSSVKDSAAKESKVKTQPNISEMSRAIENMIRKNSKNSKDLNDDVDQQNVKETIDDKPSSPISTSSKEDVALSVIRDKVIQKRKKKLKLKKLLKNKKLEALDGKVCKTSKAKLPLKEEKKCTKEKVHKGKKKKLKVGVSRNRWEVSIVPNKDIPVEIFFQDDSKSNQSTSIPSNDLNKRFYCASCDQKFESSYLLYEHQQTPEHKSKSSDLIEQKNDLSEENDPVKYCKSIGNIINDLETHKLNVNKVMHHLKLREPTETVSETVAAPAVQGPGVVELQNSGSSGRHQGVEDNSSCWQQQQQTQQQQPHQQQLDWGVQQQEWSSRSTTPLWEQQQPWDHDGFSGSSGSIGSIMDTVNKLLSSDQELVATPGYTWTDLQLAMGASDEEMAMLEQLGEHSLQEEYVYDNSRPAEEWPAADDSPTFTDLDRQDTPAPTSTLLDVKKQEPISDSEESKACRGSIGRPRRLLGDYESREMVCPTCNKHFLGLPALQTHVAWSHCSLITHAHTSRLKRRALVTAEEVDRRLVCFVCKEIVASASLLEQHIQAQHTKKDEQEPNPKQQVLSESAVKLKSKMSLALGGLVDRALNKLLGTGVDPPHSPAPTPSTSHGHNSQSDLNSGALQLLGRLCAARKRVGSENMKLSADTLQLLGRLRAVNHKDLNSRAYNNALAHEMRQILSRGKPVGVSKGALQASVNSSQQSQAMTELKPTNLLDHLAVCSSDITQRPYACPICDLRFLIPSTRNRHIARAHGKYGRRYDEEVEDPHVQDDLESGWKDVLDPGIEANDDGEMLPLCSDCGLSFQSIHEVIQHRIEDHPRRFSADEDSKPLVAFDKHPVVESSSENKQTQEPSMKDDVRMLPVSDNAIDSTSTEKKKRGRPSKVLDSKTGKNSKLFETEKKSCSNQKTNRGLGKKKMAYEEVEYPPEAMEDSNDEDDDNSDSLEALSIDESVTTESNSPEIDKSSDKLSDKHSNRASSEENLAELSKKLDRRKVRMANMAEEAVRVKAEAALRELNLPRKTKSPSSAAKWGINALKFTKQMSSGVSSSHVNGSPSKPRFASLVDKKWKVPATTGVELIMPKTEIMDVKPDIYDFRDEELDTHKKPFQQFKESHPQGEHSESNNLVQPTNWSNAGSPTKTSQSSKMSSDSS